MQIPNICINIRLFAVNNVFKSLLFVAIIVIQCYDILILLYGGACMYRVAIEKLYKWKESKHRKPLIIEGARQVGKTWLMKEFASKAYENTVYINFDSNSRMAELFASDLNTDRLIMGLELYAGHKIKAENTLLIFDEVQEVPRALSSLKYFYENAPQYHIICAGSLLGIALHGGTSFPVGKVDFLKLYPLSFKEFLMATGNERFAELLDKALQSLNSDYEAKRYNSITLSQLEIVNAPQGTFYNWMKQRGKVGGQNKIPRLSNDRVYLDPILEILK